MITFHLVYDNVWLYRGMRGAQDQEAAMGPLDKRGSEAAGAAPPIAPDDDDDDEGPILPGMWMEGDSLAPPCQSELGLVGDIIDLAGITDKDVFVDLGCGDGRICRAVAKRVGCRAVGVEIEPHLAARFRDLIRSEGLEGRVTAVEGDLREVKFEEEPTVFYVYLLPEGIRAIEATLREAIVTRGCRVVCNTWGLGSPVERRAVGHLNNTTLLLYDRRWQAEGKEGGGS